MFRHQSRRKTLIGTVFVCMELTFHLAVNQVRQSHGNAVLGLFMTIFKNVLMVGIMYFMFDLLGLRRVAVRGDFLLYVMSGVFMFMTHTAAIGAVSKADGPTSPMMLHSPMYPIIAIGGAALASLYRQSVSAGVILFLYHTFFHRIYIEHPVDLMGMYLLSWASGLGIGMVFRAMRPWQPDLATLLTTVFMRANVVASGKMVLINNMSPKLRNWFDWNPLFHTIDQGRGALFLNYTPHFTSVSYPIYVTLALFIIGLMAEFFTRQHVSLSWGRRG